MASKKTLTDKQERFVNEYLIDLNGTQAAIRAGYSADSAKEIACENFTKPNIQQALAVQMAELSKRTGISQERIVRELAKIAFLNATDVVDENGRIKPDALPDDLACIESIKYRGTEGGATSGNVEREVKLASKLKALELLGKYLGMWNDKVNVKVAVPVVISGDENLED